MSGPKIRYTREPQAVRSSCLLATWKSNIGRSIENQLPELLGLLDPDLEQPKYDHSKLFSLVACMIVWQKKVIVACMIVWQKKVIVACMIVWQKKVIVVCDTTKNWTRWSLAVIYRRNYNSDRAHASCLPTANERPESSGRHRPILPAPMATKCLERSWSLSCLAF